MRRILSCYSVVLYTGLLCAVSAMAAKEYVGTVVPTATSTYSMFTCAPIIYGNIGYIARPGEIATPEVKNSKGEIIKQGDLLLQFDMRYWVAQLDILKAIMDQNKAVADLDNIDSARYKSLASSNAESVMDYQNMQINYFNALNAYGQAVSNYDAMQAQVAAYTDIAPCEAIVTSVATSLGPIPGPATDMTIAQLNPIGIQIKMSRDEAKSISNNTPVQIIPLNSDTPQGIIYGNTVLTDDGIEFVTENYPVIEGTTLITDPSTPILRKWGFVKKFYIDKKPEVLGIASSSLNQDGDKYYVWRAKGQKTMQTDRAVDRSFQIEKVYVVPYDLYRQTENFERLVALKETGGLEFYDLVLCTAPSVLTEGQKVIYPEDAYLMMPGDQVKVIVGK
ncbi:MAG TPA: hypothetical protein DD381_04905 [Lentisphaeria bacterium]|nr:MAG: hypothetical protein A2X47_01815 [Lentisphaerae bacterium GWF2_38_69]HBM15669.1 hypothetical protein [Lentisphaeria bacterium]